ncbi:2,4-dichlorophenol 6-monooxygenase [Sarocladium strictum]
MDLSKAKPVIVIGGSLVGLSAAVCLRALGVPVTLIERHEASSPHPRAVGFTTRSFEIFRIVGLEDKIPASNAGGKGPPRRIAVESLSGKWHEEKAWTKPAETTRGPSGGKGKPPQNPLFGHSQYSPSSGSAIAQDKLEPILRARAEELGAVLRLGWTVTAWEQDTEGLQASISDKQGNQETVSGSYLVACDGARSSVRQKLGIAMHGVGHMRKLSSILFRCPPIDKYLESGYSQFAINNERMDAFLVTYRDGRWALMIWGSKSTVTEAPKDEVAQRTIIREAIGDGVELTDEDISVISTGDWDLSAEVAESFSQGRVFLAGDAAHTLPPTRGGYGANTGIADVHNLAWKLAAVLSGKSKPGLLESYSAERQPTARLRHDQVFVREDYKEHAPPGSEWDNSNTPVYEDVAIELGQLYKSSVILPDETELDSTNSQVFARRPDEWCAKPGTRAPHLWLTRRNAGERQSILDLFGRDFVLLSERDLSKDAPAGCRFVRLGQEGDWTPEEGVDAFRKAFGVSSSGAVLVRPDGYVAWRSSSGDFSADQVAHAFSVAAQCAL